VGRLGVRYEGREEEGTKWARQHRAAPLLNGARKTEEGGKKMVGGGVGTVSRPAADGAALFWAGARRGRLTHGPPLAAGEGGRREARAARGPAWKKKAWAEPEGTMTVGIYSNQF
jgi:hypothetical protein